MRLTLILLIALIALPAAAQTTGPETGLQMPRFVSLKAASGNVRRGPGLNHRIDWQFLHRGTPLMVVAEYDNWRRVEDVDGQGGWIHFSLLSGNRTLLVRADTLPLFTEPREDARIAAHAERGAILTLDTCTGAWCSVTAGRHEGYVQAGEVWGADLHLAE